MVLKNTGDVLPLSTTSSIALVGAQACNTDPLAIAGGSGWNGMACQEVNKANVKDGIRRLGINSLSCPDQADHGNSAAETADIVVAVVTPAKASEGSDRETLQLSQADTQLIKRYANAGKKVVVAMNAPGPMITSTWDANVAGLLVSWVPGVANGDGIAQALYNHTYEASGRLPVTFPKCSTEACTLQDERASVHLGDKIADKSYYHHDEGSLIGYRWYHAQNREVSYPFGFGLFAYGRSTVAYSDARQAVHGEGVKVHVNLQTSGQYSGTDVPQLYLKFPESVPGPAEYKPEWVLKGFRKIRVSPGNAVEASFGLTKRDFSYWDEAPGQSKWVCASGNFVACVGSNSRDAVNGQGACVTFASPCGEQPTLEQKFVAEPILNDAEATAVRPPLSVAVAVGGSIVLGATLFAWRRRRSIYMQAFEVLGLDEGEAPSRTQSSQSCVE